MSPAAWLARSLDDALGNARKVTEVTHDHPEGLKGAAAAVHAIVLAREGAPPESIRQAIAARYGNYMDRMVGCALEASSFEDAIRNAISLGGDSDTLAAIAGPVAEARFGIPADIAARGRAYLPEEMRRVLDALYA